MKEINYTVPHLLRACTLKKTRLQQELRDIIQNSRDVCTEELVYRYHIYTANGEKQQATIQ